MIIRFLYNVLAFVYNRHVETYGETTAYHTALCALSLPLAMLIPMSIHLCGYQLRVITGTKWDALPLSACIIGTLWLLFPKKKVIEHAQVATKKEQKISTILFVILIYSIYLLVGIIYIF